MGVTVFQLGQGWSPVHPIERHVELLVDSSDVQPEGKHLPRTSTTTRTTDPVIVLERQQDAVVTIRTIFFAKKFIVVKKAACPVRLCQQRKGEACRKREIVVDSRTHINVSAEGVVETHCTATKDSLNPRHPWPEHAIVAVAVVNSKA